MKKKFILLLAAAAAGMLLLTACTSSENGITVSGENNNNGNQSGTGTQTGSDVQNGTTGGSADQNTWNEAQGTSDGSSGEQQGSSQQGTIQEEPGVVEAPEEGGGPVEDGGPDGDVIPDEYAEGENVQEELQQETYETVEGWSGTYVGEQETVTLNKLDESTVAFSFKESGISGTAELKGYQAIYKGDDHYVVVFTMDDGMMDVTVSNEEDYDASGSPLIGHYIKET